MTEPTKGKQNHRLWVREKALYWTGGAGGTSNIAYADDPELPGLLEDNSTLLIPREVTNILAGKSVLGRWAWRPSIFMPRWASRITLEITGVRVEKLQEITEEDCQKEGLQLLQGGIRSGFAVLWDSINGKKHPWSENLWVWVISFKRVT